jgi:tetratricopeptide (TPR) repeat protein
MEDSIGETTTFDPKILGDDTWDGLYFDPFTKGFGGACDECVTKAIADDWRGFVGMVPDWDRVLRQASASDLAVLEAYTSGKAKAAPRGYEKIPVTANVAAAIAYVRVMRDVEPYMSLVSRPTQELPSDLLPRIKSGMKATKEPFLVQRYAYLALRSLFYSRKWRDAVAWHDANAATLDAPSVDVKWRSRYYVAGALARDGHRDRANLELARLVSGYAALSGAAMGDFQPIEEKDWQATLAGAKSVREKTELWRLVGIKSDGIVAIEKILDLDPKSNLVALLLVRELAKAESTFSFDENGNDATAEATRRKTLHKIEMLGMRIAAKPDADRPWLAELVVGHIAAKRGDLVVARVHLQKAVQLAPRNHEVATQAKASLALALVLDWKIDASHEDEIAHLMGEIDPKFTRLSSVRTKVRTQLSHAYQVANRLVDAEFLSSGAGTSWADIEFIKKMIARSNQTSTAFDRFVVEGISKEQLKAELFGREIMMGDYIDAQKSLHEKPVAIGTDPFLIHIRDCHDCDRDGYKGDLTDATFVAKLIELQKTAAGKSEAAAAASLELGNALYNLTWFGNARVVFESTHQATRDTRPAEAYYKRAYELTRNKELKAKAAFLASKAEFGRLAETDNLDTLPTPVTWFPLLKKLSDTKYYKEILRECGNFRRWAETK